MPESHADNTTEDSANKLINLLYSLNGGVWSKYTPGTAVNLDKNDYVEFKANGSNETISKSETNFYRFAIDKKVNASGNIQSLLVEDGFKDKTDVPAWCYFNMFWLCTSLQTAPHFPATTLADYCYSGIFEGCTSLQTAPDLPAMTLASYCYNSMFDRCTSLQIAPDLPAMTLASSCYDRTFMGCTKFDSVNMKKSMQGVYSTSTHGNTMKTVKYVLD